MTLIGLTGYAQSGKNTLAAEIRKKHPEFREVAFADKLKELAIAIDPYTGDQWYDLPETLGLLLGNRSIDQAKGEFFVRDFLQRLGVACRDVLGEDVWVDAALGEAPRVYGDTAWLDDVVVTDVRFPNETVAIKDRGGVIVRVERSGVGPVNGHISETALDLWQPDLTIYNTGLPEHMLVPLYDRGILEYP